MYLICQYINAAIVTINVIATVVVIEDTVVMTIITVMGVVVMIVVGIGHIGLEEEDVDVKIKKAAKLAALIICTF